MNEPIAKKSISEFWVYWLLVNSLGWSMRIVDLWMIKSWGIRSLPELPRIFILSSIGGVIGGLIIGIGQQRVLRCTISLQRNDWWWKTVIGKCLLAPAGIGIIILIVWISTSIRGDVFLPENQSMGIFFYPNYLFYGGLSLGIMQWTSLRGFLENPGWKEACLWIFGIWTSIGIGILIGKIATSVVLNNITQVSSWYAIEHIVTGLIYAIVSGVIVLILVDKMRE